MCSTESISGISSSASAKPASDLVEKAAEAGNVYDKRCRILHRNVAQYSNWCLYDRAGLGKYGIQSCTVLAGPTHLFYCGGGLGHSQHWMPP